MEDNADNFDIYYQYNSFDDIKEEDRLSKIKENPYFLIETTKDKNSKFTFEKLENLLINDGMDKSKISEYRILLEDKRKGVTHYYAKPFSCKTYEKYIKLNEIYLHLIIKENEQKQEDPILKEMEDYNVKIAKAGKNVEALYKELFHEKKIISNTIFNIAQNFFPKNNIPDEREIKTFIKPKKLNNSNIISNEIPTDIIKEESNEIEDNNINIPCVENLNKIGNNSMNYHLLKKLNSMQIFEKKEEIKLCFLYANPLVNEDNKNTYKDTDYFDEMITIYDIFKNTNFSAQLEFEPIIYEFNRYIEKYPDIVHIKVKSSKDQQRNMKIELDYLGKLSFYKYTDLKMSLCTETGVSHIKLLIVASQNIDDLQQYFKGLGIKNIIYIDNKMEKGSYPLPIEAEENFIKELYYYMLIEGLSIQESFKISNKGNSENKITFIQTNPNGKDYISSSKKKEKKSKNNLSSKKLIELKQFDNPYIKLNRNCSLNLDFVKYNYKRIIGRNIELKECIKMMQRYNNVCICGHPGVGKKSFAQLAGKFAFERYEYKEVHFITIYNLGNAQFILMNKIKNINNSNKKIDESQMEFDNKKILLIIYYDNIISEESDIKTFEEIVNKIKCNNIYFLYVFTIAKEFNFGKVKRNLYDTPMIELHKLESGKRLDLFNLICYNLEKNIKKFMRPTNNQLKELLNKTNGYPNDIYLLVLFISYFKERSSKIINDSNNKKNIEEIIFMNFIENEEKFGNKMKKIFSIFAILKLGVRDDILNLFFDEKEINLIENRLNLVILEEKDEKGKNYVLDSSFRNLVKSLLMDKKYEDELINNLNLILEKYAIILRYLVNSQKYKDKYFQFHAGENQDFNDFWFSVNEKKIRSNFQDEYEKFKNSSGIIYFDVVKYFINILDLFSDEYYFSKMELNINKLIEYISQISICLPTILYFNNTNNIIYINAIESVFTSKLGKLKLYRSLFRLKIFKYWLSGDSSFLPKWADLDKISGGTCNEKGGLNDNIKAEFNLVKIYDHIIKKDNIDITNFYNECKNCSRNNKFNLEKLKKLYNENTKVIKVDEDFA